MLHEEVNVSSKKKAGTEAEIAEEQEEGQVEPVEAEVVVEEAEAEKRDELERLQKELEQTKAQAAEYLDGWQRAQAEFSNYKKRQEVERAQMAQLASMGLLRKLLPVTDDFERALTTLPANLSRLSWCEGILLIKYKLDAILESEGVKPIETAGKSFDPLYHEAVTYEEATGYADGQIVGEVQRGYMMGERVLRPAMVRVAKSPAVQPAESTEAAEKEE
jgi:molecular chaperone GrpE